MMMPDDLSATVRGDLVAFARLHEVPHQALLTAQAKAPDLILMRSALHSVLGTLHQDRSTMETIQRWASFVRRGYATVPTDSPIIPLTITYNPPDEEIIVTIISRLDELGDMVDGTIDGAELALMLQATEA